MSIHIALNHVTRYRYDRLVTLSPQLVRLRPAPHCRTPILSYSQRITPAEHFINWQQDPQSNYVARLTFPERVKEFCVEVDVVAEMAVYDPFDFFLEPAAEMFPFVYEEWEQHELQPYLHTEPLTPHFAEYLGTIDRTRRRTIDALVDINRQLQRDIPMSSASIPACRRSSRRWAGPPAHAATRRGCSCSCFDTWGSPRASCLAT